MDISDYTFKIGELALIYEIKVKEWNIDLSQDRDLQMNEEMFVETDYTNLNGELVIIDQNDFILLPNLMKVMIGPKRPIGNAIQIPGYLIKFPSLIITRFGVRYIRFKLTFEMHRLILETHRFAFKAFMTLEQISNMKLSLVEEEAKLVNADASEYMKKIEEATAKAIFAHKRAIEEWKADMKILSLNNQHWH